MAGSQCDRWFQWATRALGREPLPETLELRRDARDDESPLYTWTVSEIEAENLLRLAIEDAVDTAEADADELVRSFRLVTRTGAKVFDRSPIYAVKLHPQAQIKDEEATDQRTLAITLKHLERREAVLLPALERTLALQNQAIERSNRQEAHAFDQLLTLIKIVKDEKNEQLEREIKLLELSQDAKLQDDALNALKPLVPVLMAQVGGKKYFETEQGKFQNPWIDMLKRFGEALTQEEMRGMLAALRPELAIALQKFMIAVRAEEAPDFHPDKELPAKEGGKKAKNGHAKA